MEKKFNKNIKNNALLFLKNINHMIQSVFFFYIREEKNYIKNRYLNGYYII